MTIYGLDVYSLFEEMLNKTYPGLPQQFDTTHEASQSTLANDSADNYLFWDGVHPTEFVHKLLGDAACCPDPAYERQLRFGDRYNGNLRDCDREQLQCND